jgi:hypothetical protein
MTDSGGAKSPERPGSFFPAVYDELKRLAAGFSHASAFREWAYARSWLATALRSGP